MLLPAFTNVTTSHVCAKYACNVSVAAMTKITYNSAAAASQRASWRSSVRVKTIACEPDSAAGVEVVTTDWDEYEEGVSSCSSDARMGTIGLDYTSGK